MDQRLKAGLQTNKGQENKAITKFCTAPKQVKIL